MDSKACGASVVLSTVEEPFTYVSMTLILKISKEGVFLCHGLSRGLEGSKGLS